MEIAANIRLGWDHAASITGGGMYGKNGARNLGPGTLHDGTSALIVANFRAPDGAPGFRTLLADAYDAAVNP